MSRSCLDIALIINVQVLPGYCLNYKIKKPYWVRLVFGMVRRGILLSMLRVSVPRLLPLRCFFLPVYIYPQVSRVRTKEVSNPHISPRRARIYIGFSAIFLLLLCFASLAFTPANITSLFTDGVVLLFWQRTHVNQSWNIILFLFLFHFYLLS